MLSQGAVMAVIPAKDIERANNFYTNTLGFTPEHSTPEGGTVFQAGDGTRFLVYPTSFAGTGQHTIAAFAVADLRQEVADLRSRGVTFNDYDFGETRTEDGIMTMGDFSSAWFTDPEDNIIAVSQGTM